MSTRTTKIQKGESVSRRPAARMHAAAGRSLTSVFKAGLFVGVAAVTAAATSDFATILVTQGLLMATWAMSLAFLAHGGLMSFAHAAWFGIGGYVAAYMGRHVTSDMFLGVSIAIVVTIVASAIIAPVVMRVSGVAFKLMTLAVGQIVFVVALRWISVTGGADGIVGASVPTALGVPIHVGNRFYWLSVAIVGLAFVLIRGLVSSPFGQAFAATREDEVRAAFVGINVRLHRVVAFIMASGIAGMAGALFVYHQGTTSPAQLHWFQNAAIVIIVIMGGRNTIAGPGIAALLWVLLMDLVTARFGVAWQLFFGVPFVLSVLFLPNGLGGAVLDGWLRVSRVASRVRGRL